MELMSGTEKCHPEQLCAVLTLTMEERLDYKVLDRFDIPRTGDAGMSLS